MQIIKNKNIYLSILAAILFSCQHMNTSKDVDVLKLWYTQPAANWNEALPLGNGRLGAMIFGDPVLEHLQLNEETIWAGGPHNNVNPESAKYLKIVRDLIFAEKYVESHSVANENIKSYQNGMPYQPIGDLFLTFPQHENYTNYYRELDISNAVSRVEYSIDDKRFIRETFSSFTNDVIVVKLSCNKPASLDFSISLKTEHKHELNITNDELILHGITSDYEDIPGQVKFTTIIKPVLKNGTLSKSDSSLNIENADEVILYLSTATNFINYKDLSADEEKKAREHLIKALKTNYEQTKKEHIAFYKNYFDRVSLDLGTSDSINNPTDVRLAQYKTGYDPQLATLYFQYGRYLLISSSQPGGQPTNLQGIWNHLMEPPWESKYTININCEMNYWPSEVTNLSELSEPLFHMVEDLSESGKESAQKLYNARGWVAHHNTDIWRVTGIFDRATYGMWQSGSNWLTQHLWQHFLFSGDTAFLKKYYPVMKSASEFYVDELIEEPHTGYLVICPSNSPENKFMNLASSSAGTTMDNQLLFDLFSNVIRSSEILGTDKEFADTLKNLKERLAPMQIGQYNQLQEWLFDFDDTTDHHRHVSHLYGLYPSNQISPYRTPKLFQAARQSLLYRGDESTGWSMGWKVNLWARLLDGNHAYKLISDQLSPAIRPGAVKAEGGTYANLLDAHPPFQIDGNLGCTAGIAEMLVQSYDGFIFILPALPDKWPKGKVTGLKAKGGFIVDIEWENNKVKEFTIKSELGGNCRIRTKNDIIPEGNVALLPANQKNKNPLYALNKIKKPIISEKANIKPLELKETFLYDFQSIKGNSYTFKLK